MFAFQLVLGSGIAVRPEGNIGSRLTCESCGVSVLIPTRDEHLLARLADRFTDHFCLPRHAFRGGEGA